MNKFVGMGNLTRDPELRQTNGGVAVVNFGVAINRKYKKGDETVNEPVFIDCEAWDSGAETISNYFQKGSRILIEGSLKQETWEKDGEKRSKLKVRVERFYFVDSKKNGDDSQSQAPAQAPAKSEAPKGRGRAKATANAGDGGGEGEGGTIPF